MKTLSLKLDDNIFEDTDKLSNKLNMARNCYINDALDVYNTLNKRKLSKDKLHKESKSIRMNSLEILKEMEKLIDGI